MSAVLKEAPVTHDLVTLLQADPDKRATKKWTAGTIEPYDAGWKFRTKTVKVGSIRGLSKLLKSVESDPRTFVVRGNPKPLSELEGVEREKQGKAIAGPDQVRKWKECFTDLPLHYILIDIDGFKPDGIDPVADPVGAINQYVTKVLPPEFDGVTYHWQLSSSAGAPGNAGMLKAHVWFWLTTPYSSHQMYEWAAATSVQIDKSTFQVVQIHYTANPVFDGVEDPVPLRSGIEEGWLGADEVDLVLSDTILLRAAEASTRKVSGHELVDPKEKKGPIGAFHRCFSMDDVLERWLGDHFTPGSLDHRLTWTAGNSPEGAFITDDNEHIVITNNTCPAELEGPINKFDLVRYFVFGHLDAGVDEFELMDMTGRPSFKATMDMIAALPEIKAEANVGRAFRVEQYKAKIAAAIDAYTLEQEVCLEIANDRALIDMERIQLAPIVKARADILLNANTPIGTVRTWIAPTAGNGGWTDVDADGNPQLTIGNVAEVLRRERVTVRYNVMTKEEELLVPGHSFSLANMMNASLAHIISACAAEGLMGTATIKAYLTAIADSNQYNPMMTWITSQPWDGVSRLQAVYDTLHVAPEHAAIRDKMLRKWMLSAVTAAATPQGIMARGILVLVGPQYLGKSRWVQSLAPLPGMVREGQILDPKDKDSVKLAVSAWITELGELDATFKKAEISALKAFIAKAVDSFRKPYALTESTFPRQTVFVGTVNDETYLRDLTGGTRYWSIKVEAIDHNHTINMQQVWAEIYETQFMAGEEHWMSVDDMAVVNEHNEDFTEIDPVEELMRTRLNWNMPADKWAWVTATDLAGYLGLGTSRGETTHIGKITAKMKLKKRRTNGVSSVLAPGVQQEFL